MTLCVTKNVSRKTVNGINWKWYAGKRFQLADNFTEKQYEPLVDAANDKAYWKRELGENKYFEKIGLHQWIGCSPLAAAVIFKYIGTANFLYGSCIPGDYKLLKTLHLEMFTTYWGATSPFDMPDGIEGTAAIYGFEVESRGPYITPLPPSFKPFDMTFNIVKNEINHNRMVHFSMGYDRKYHLHSVAVFGYEIKKRIEKYTKTDWLCPDYRWIRFYSGDYSKDSKHIDWFSTSLIEYYSTVVVRPVKPCSSEGGGGSGGFGCKIAQGGIFSAVFSFGLIIFFLMLIRIRSR